MTELSRRDGGLTFEGLGRRGHGAGGGGRDGGVGAGRAAEVLDDLGVGAGLAGGALLQQLGQEGGGVALHQGVLLALHALHQRAHQRVQLVGQRLQVDHGAGHQQVHAQVQPLPLGAGLLHRAVSLLPLAVQRLPLRRLAGAELRRGLGEDAGYLGNKGWGEHRVAPS